MELHDTPTSKMAVLMETNYAPLLADLFLYSHDNECLDKFIKGGGGGGGGSKLAKKCMICFSPEIRAATTYDKRNAFGFHIMTFPSMSDNIPPPRAYGVYAPQLIHYVGCCSNYSDFLPRHRALVTRLLLQGNKVNCLSKTFKKFYGRHTRLVGQYKKIVCCLS